MGISDLQQQSVKVFYFGRSHLSIQTMRIKVFFSSQGDFHAVIINTMIEFPTQLDIFLEKRM